MNNLELFCDPESYQIHAGELWPSYSDFIKGNYSVNDKIKQEIDQYVKQKKLDGIKFPIKSKTACQSKWTWSTIFLNTLETASCHKVGHVKFELEDFDNFHNLPKKLNDRKLMLEGKWPTGGCEYCKNIEDAGGFSDRMHNLDIRGLTPPELESDQTAINVTPRIVEIFAQNLCNFQCIYCEAPLSSKIEAENKKFGEFNKDGVVIPVYNIPESTKDYFKKFIHWLENNIHTLVRLHLLGGETLLQHDLMTSVLDIIEKNPNPNLELCVFSNLNSPDKIWNTYISRIKDLQKAKNIKCFDLTVSIDCWGVEQEYVRSGINLKMFEERFAWAAGQGDWLRLNVNQTVTAMTIKTMVDLIKKISLYSKEKHIGHYFQFVTGYNEFQHPKHFSYELWDKDFENILQAMPKITVHQREAIPRMIGLQKQLQQSKVNNYKEIKRLHVYLDEIDRRRGTNWRQLFSYLDIHE